MTENQLNDEHWVRCPVCDSPPGKFCVVNDQAVPTIHPERQTAYDVATAKRNDNLTEVIDGRRGIYGEPAIVFPLVAQVWSGILGHEVKDTDVALLLMGYKLVRTAWAPDYSDNSDDIEGYLDIFRELVGEDMIHARSVSDYLAQRAQREAE